MAQLWPSILLFGATYVTPTLGVPYTWVLSDFFYEKLFIKVPITVNLTICVCSFELFCLKNWPRAWWLMILITKRVFCWDGACLLLQLIELRKFVAYLQLIVPFQYALRYQLIFTCFNFLPCCFDNSRYLIGSQKPIRRKSSTCLNYLATRENHQRICKKKYLRMRN